MRFVVTGAHGSVGAHVVNAALASGHSALALVPQANDLAAWRRRRVKCRSVDLENPFAVANTIRGYDVLVHSTFAVPGAEPASTQVYEHQKAVVAQLLHGAARARVERVLLTSSFLTCRRMAPPPGGASEDQPPTGIEIGWWHGIEREFLNTAASLGLSATVVCPTVVLGGPGHELGTGNSLVVRYLIDRLRTTYPGGCNVVSAWDVGAAHVLLAERGSAGAKYVVGGENLSWQQFHQATSALCGVGGPYMMSAHPEAHFLSTAVPVHRKRGKDRLLAMADHSIVDGRFHWYDDGGLRALGYESRPEMDILADAVHFVVTHVDLRGKLERGLTFAPAVNLARDRWSRWCLVHGVSE